MIDAFNYKQFSTVKGKICEKPSKTWFGKCQDTTKCDKQCIEWEDAKHGACHERESKLMCFCYYNCGPPKNTPPGTPPSPPPPPGSPPPPPEGGQPPPEGGQPPPEGGQPPPAEGGQPPPAEGGQPPPA
ncbi:hypothetical protein Ccrd_010893 [Cynara cardunculus var. scolymus]|uniref:Knottins-like domain-containing protein n=1 Tax=Cynara cardunculus var. scolymus TaxID=59895 RepID=A0A118K6I4_CYNCS|nr:hypothetical protein Ccrd_010893 [Cynara cardunculus var. scolymus]